MPFGFLGLRTDQPELYISPSLPPQIPHVVVRDFYFAGAGIRATMNRTTTTLTRFSTENIPEVRDKYEGQPMPVVVGSPEEGAETRYNISVDETLYIPNRMYWQLATVKGNILQCRQIYSFDAYAPGQFPQAAIDGAIATAWQPSNNKSASIMVNTTMSPYQPIKEIYFNWGARPPMNATVFIGNTTEMCDGRVQLSGTITEIPIDGVHPSDRYNETVAAAAVVVPYEGNVTHVMLGNDVYSGNFAQLVIEGCYECAQQEEEGQEPGASVAEWAIIGEQDKLGMNGKQAGSEGGQEGSDIATAPGATSGESQGNGTTSNPGAEGINEKRNRILRRNLFEKEE